jgi:PST family polysaccharide transporter
VTEAAIAEEPADPAPPTVQEIGSRARRSVKVLLVRLGIFQGISLLTGIFLARILGPEPFGIFSIAMGIVAIFNVAGDLGLGAALIQRHEALKEEELRGAFTIQTLLGLAVSALALLLGPTVEQHLWGTEHARALLVPVVLGAVIVNPFRTVTTIILERNLAFVRVTAIETGEYAVYCGVSLALAWRGWGVAALGGAVLARGMTGLLLATALTPWRPRLTRHLGAARALLAFGIPQQTAMFVYTLSSLVVPLVVGRFEGEKALGLVLWALGNAERPKPLLEMIGRVAFPSYARLRAAPEVIQAGFERSLHGGLLAVTLWAGLLGGLAPVAVGVIYGPVWLPGVRLIYVFLAFFPVVTVTIMLDIVFLARGDSVRVRNLHMVRMVLSWVLAVPLTATLGVSGYALAYALAMSGFALGELLSARQARLGLGRIARTASGPLAAGVAAALASRGVMVVLAPTSTIAALFAGGAVGAAAFAVVELAVDRERLRRSVEFLLRRG